MTTHGRNPCRATADTVETLERDVLRLGLGACDRQSARRLNAARNPNETGRERTTATQQATGTGNLGWKPKGQAGTRKTEDPPQRGCRTEANAVTAGNRVAKAGGRPPKRTRRGQGKDLKE